MARVWALRVLLSWMTHGQDLAVNMTELECHARMDDWLVRAQAYERRLGIGRPMILASCYQPASLDEPMPEVGPLIDSPALAAGEPLLVQRR